MSNIYGYINNDNAFIKYHNKNCDKNNCNPQKEYLGFAILCSGIEVCCSLIEESSFGSWTAPLQPLLDFNFPIGGRNEVIGMPENPDVIEFPWGVELIPAGAVLAQNLSNNFSILNNPPSNFVINPSGVTLPENTDTTSPIFMASASITDDGLGTLAVFIDGPDAGYFSVSGIDPLTNVVEGPVSLYLNAGVVLDYEVKQEYNITLSVNDLGVVGDEIEKPFRLKVANVIEANTNAYYLQTQNAITSNFWVLDSNPAPTWTYDFARTNLNNIGNKICSKPVSFDCAGANIRWSSAPPTGLGLGLLGGPGGFLYSQIPYNISGSLNTDITNYTDLTGPTSGLIDLIDKDIVIDAREAIYEYSYESSCDYDISLIKEIFQLEKVNAVKPAFMPVKGVQLPAQGTIYPLPYFITNPVILHIPDCSSTPCVNSTSSIDDNGLLAVDQIRNCAESVLCSQNNPSGPGASFSGQYKSINSYLLSTTESFETNNCCSPIYYSGCKVIGINTDRSIPATPNCCYSLEAFCCNTIFPSALKDNTCVSFSQENRPILLDQCEWNNVTDQKYLYTLHIPVCTAELQGAYHKTSLYMTTLQGSYADEQLIPHIITFAAGCYTEKTKIDNIGITITLGDYQPPVKITSGGIFIEVYYCLKTYKECGS